MRKNVIRAVVCSALLVLTTGIVQAKIYKWVDENGVTQYTQYPPPKGDSKEVNVPAAPSAPTDEQRKELQERLEAFNKRRDERLRDAQESEEQRAEREKLAADCQRIRDDLEVVRNNPRLFEEAEDGSRVRMTEERRQERIGLAEQQLKDFCSDV
ncbi:MAG: DUF4124 domain-containing protein [Gammaproteobacteria bacterium]|nr:DUF4124 domain-containing protein [Gammaproteobacteria bacterium]